MVATRISGQDELVRRSLARLGCLNQLTAEYNRFLTGASACHATTEMLNKLEGYLAFQVNQTLGDIVSEVPLTVIDLVIESEGDDTNGMDKVGKDLLDQDLKEATSAS